MAANPVRCLDETVTILSRWDVGAAGAHTKASNCNGTGISGIARTAAGKYTITFQRGMPVGPLLDLRITHWPVADAGQKSVRPTKAGYTAETAAAAATALYEAWSIGTTPAQIELESGCQVTVEATFQKTK